MTERLYNLRHGQVVFETGTAYGKQLLLAATVHEILLHWFGSDGAFLGMDRHRMAVAPAAFAGTTVYQTDSRYWDEVERELSALKESIGFVPKDIAVRKFESEEASIEDLPGEYEQFLHDPRSYSPEERETIEKCVRQWRESGRFVLDIYEQYWISSAGEVESS